MSKNYTIKTHLHLQFVISMYLLKCTMELKILHIVYFLHK